MARHNRIPVGVSSPAHLGAPSLLTSVPPEIRNAIYILLFTREQVLVHNTKAYHAVAPDPADFTCSAGYLAQVNAYNDIYNDEIGADAEFHDGIGLGLPLLQSCRQIYHESVGVLYGFNTLVLSRALNRHDCDVDPFHETHSYSQLHLAPKWFHGLGSQGCLLRYAHIDVDAACPRGCEHDWDHFDILPLLNFLWHDAHKDFKLRFTHNGRRISVHEDDNHPTAYTKADVYNNILHALATNDALRIKRFDYPIAHLEVSPRYEFVTLKYTRRGRCFDHSDDIKISDEGQVVHRTPITEFRNFFESSTLEMNRHILRLALSTQSLNEIMFDVDNRTIRNLPMNILQVSPMFRHRYLGPSVIGTTSSVTFKTVASFTDANFDSLASVLDLMHREVWHNYGDKRAPTFLEVVYQSSHHTHASIALHLTPKLDTLLEDVRIDVKALISSFHHTSLGDNVSVQITLGHTNDYRAYTSWTGAYSKLQKSIFLVLSDMLLDWPSHLKTTLTKRAPSIWINGRGTVLEASYLETATSASFSVPNRHAELRPEEIDFKGYCYAAKVIQGNHRRFPLTHRASTTSLFEMWEILRDIHWPDWEMRCLQS